MFQKVSKNCFEIFLQQIMLELTFTNDKNDYFENF